MNNNDDWTPEEIARASDRQREISEAAERNQALLELRKSKKTSIVYIFTRLLIGLIPFLLTLFAWPVSSGFQVFGDLLGLFRLLILSCFLCLLSPALGV